MKEERREKERRREGGVDYAAAVLSCVVDNMYLLFEACDLRQWFHLFLHKKSDADMYI